MLQTIRETKKGLLTTYDVTTDGYCINERGNSRYEILEVLRRAVEDDDLAASLEYFSVLDHNKDSVWPFEARRIAVFYVRGGSEGYYVHVEVFHPDETHELIFLAKTLKEGAAGVRWSERMVCTLSRTLQV